MPNNLENIQVQGKYTYTIGPEIGSGSFGSVHRATRRDGLERAMKITQMSPDPLDAFRFAQEAYMRLNERRGIGEVLRVLTYNWQRLSRQKTLMKC